MVLDREERRRGGGEGRPVSTLCWHRGAGPDSRWREMGGVRGGLEEWPRVVGGDVWGWLAIGRGRPSRVGRLLTVSGTGWAWAGGAKPGRAASGGDGVEGLWAWLRPGGGGRCQPGRWPGRRWQRGWPRVPARLRWRRQL
jgi:hypothetical protein